MGLDYWCGRANPESITAVARAFELVGDRKSQELLAWQYLKHLGGAYLAIAHDERGLVEGVAAMYAAFPTRSFDGEAPTVFVQSFDTLTLPEYRGRGLMESLANMVYTAAARDGVSVVYGVPNAYSFPVFTKRLEWTMMDPLPMLVRPIGLRYLLVRLGLRTPLAPDRERHVSIPVELDELAAVDRRVGPTRSVDYLEWRLSRPAATYHTHEVRGSDGRLNAWAVSELVYKHGCLLGYVIELVIRPGEAAAGRKVLRALTSDLTKSGADLILAWSLSGIERSSFLRSGFLRYPERFRPVTLHFGARYLLSTIRKRSEWRLSYVDSDTI